MTFVAIGALRVNCTVAVCSLCLFFTVLCVGLQSVIVTFPDHTLGLLQFYVFFFVFRSLSCFCVLNSLKIILLKMRDMVALPLFFYFTTVSWCLFPWYKYLSEIYESGIF